MLIVHMLRECVGSKDARGDRRLYPKGWSGEIDGDEAVYLVAMGYAWAVGEWPEDGLISVDVVRAIIELFRAENIEPTQDDVTREIAVEGLASNFAISFNGVLVLVLAGLAWRAAAARNIASHRRWALRAFVVINGVFFLRLMVFGYIVLAQSPPSDLLFDVLTYLSYLLPLALMELYLRAKDGPGIARVGTAALVLAATAYMAVGIVGYTLIFVNRVLGA